MIRNIPFFGGIGVMKLKRPRRPQNMFLFDPDFRHRHVDDVYPVSSGAPGESADAEQHTKRKCEMIVLFQLDYGTALCVYARKYLSTNIIAYVISVSNIMLPDEVTATSNVNLNSSRNPKDVNRVSYAKTEDDRFIPENKNKRQKHEISATEHLVGRVRMNSFPIQY